MKELYIWTHLGMGDHIICNAIIRHYAKKYDIIYVFVKTGNLKNIQYMYRDLKNIRYIDGIGGQDEFVKQYLQIHPFIPLLKVGHEHLNSIKLHFDEAFYYQLGIPFENRFTDFYVQRDMEKENELCKLLNPTGEPYAFVHKNIFNSPNGGPSGKLMNMDYIKNKNLKIIDPDESPKEEKQYLLFHYIKLIEEAEEVHVMESSFRNLINYAIPYKENVFLHKYMRGIASTGRNYWNVIEN
jgi:hypothetical protein